MCVCVCVQRINEHKHMCDKVEAHEANVLDFCGSHGCQVERDLLGHVRRTGYIIVYTELSDHGGLKLFFLTLYNLFTILAISQRALVLMAVILKYIPI